MRGATDWIKTRDDDFSNQQSAYLELVVAKKVAWGIPDTAIDPLLDLQTEYEPLYETVQDKKNRTGADVAAHRDCRKRFQTALRKFHKEWVVNNSKISVADKVILVGKARDTEPTPRGKIGTFPIIDLKNIGGGDIEVRARVTTDQTRFSMHPLADEVECKYTFVPSGEMPPEDTDATGLKTQGSKKARFLIACGVKNAGQSFWGFFRWANKSLPANNGPWTTKAKGVVIA